MSRPTFWQCVEAAASQPGLVHEFDRLSGHHLSQIASRSPLEAEIDRATGRDRQAIIAFLAFVYEFVYLRVPEATP